MGYLGDMVKRERLPADIRARLAGLGERFRTDPQVVALYLFGSFARGSEGPLSDVDLALLLDPAVPRAQFARLTLDYLTAINRLLGTDEVSFILLNDAPLTFRYEVVRTGKILVDNRPEVRLAFEVRTEDLYMDFKPAIDRYDNELLRQLTADVR
jgi:predicted nucleotidyltransferase